MLPKNISLKKPSVSVDELEHMSQTLLDPFRKYMEHEEVFQFIAT
jgi:hypothetical protein